MRTEKRNTKGVIVHGMLHVLYRGKGDCWFLHMDEALDHSRGRTGYEALKIIIGTDHINYPFHASGGIPHRTIPITKEFRQYLNNTRCAL